MTIVTLTGEAMAMQLCTNITSKLKFLYRKNKFLSKDLRRLNLYKSKLEILQKKCLLFCLQLDSRQHIGTENLNNINWLPIDQRFKQFFSTIVLKFFSEMYLQYMNEIYQISNQNKADTRNSFLGPFQPLRSKSLT